jgi:hypothetical protein
MVGFMATWSTTRGSAAFKAAVGLLLLALIAVASTPAWAGGFQHEGSSATHVVTPDTEMSALSTPPQSPYRAEHLPRPWPVRHRAVTAPTPPVAVWPESGSAAIRGPQQPGHRAAGSRSPPAA